MAMLFLGQAPVNTCVAASFSGGSSETRDPNISMDLAGKRDRYEQAQHDFRIIGCDANSSDDLVCTRRLSSVAPDLAPMLLFASEFRQIVLMRMIR